MKLKRITLIHFQNHKKLVVDFSPRLNIISGVTGAGKSAIFRALNLVTDNEPSAADKVYSSPNYKIIVETTEGHKITRTPKAYTLTINGQTEEFKGFGTNVPDPIKSILNLKPANWQRQLTKHFLLFETPGAIAKIISTVAGADEQDLLLKEIKNRIQSEGKKYNLYSNRISESKRELEKLSAIPRYYKKINSLQMRNSKIEEIKFNIDNLNLCLKEIQSLEVDLQKENKINKWLVGIKQLIIKNTNLQNMYEKIVLLENILSNIITNISNYNPKIKILEKFLERFFILEQKHNRLQAISGALGHLNQIIEKEIDCKEELEFRTAQHEKLKQQLKLCPYCGGKF